MFDYSVCDLCVRDLVGFGSSGNPCEDCEDLRKEKELIAAIFGSIDDQEIRQQIIKAPCSECCNSNFCKNVDLYCEDGLDECEYFDPLPKEVPHES